MDDDKKKKIMIAVAIVCIVIAVGVMVMTSTGEDTSNSDKKITLMCKNPKCKAVYEVSEKELDNLLAANGLRADVITISPTMESMTVKCKKCGKKSAQVAEKCKKCERLFILNYDATNDYPDRCPNCGYSEMEKLRNGTRQ